MKPYWIVKTTDDDGTERITRFKNEDEAKAYWKEFLIKTGRITA